MPAVGGRRLTMNGEEGARVTKTLGLKAAFPAHFEGWEHYQEGRDAALVCVDRVGAVSAGFAPVGILDHLRWDALFCGWDMTCEAALGATRL